MPAPMRIVHVVDSLGKGGLENGLVNLIARLDPERFEHVIYAIRSLGSNTDRLPKDRVRVVCHRKNDLGARNQVRRDLGVSPDEFCIGSVGNSFPVKDHMTLLKAIEKVARAFMNWRLLVGGERPKPPISEGTSNALLEAMATRVPEVVLDEESGLLFAVGDSGRLAVTLLERRAGKDLRVQLAQRALRRIKEDFSIDSMVRNYAQMYESLLSVAMAPMGAVAGV